MMEINRANELEKVIELAKQNGITIDSSAFIFFAKMVFNYTEEKLESFYQFMAETLNQKTPINSESKETEQ